MNDFWGSFLKRPTIKVALIRSNQNQNGLYYLSWQAENARYVKCNLRRGRLPIMSSFPVQNHGEKSVEVYFRVVGWFFRSKFSLQLVSDTAMVRFIGPGKLNLKDIAIAFQEGTINNLKSQSYKAKIKLFRLGKLQSVQLVLPQKPDMDSLFET